MENKNIEKSKYDNKNLSYEEINFLENFRLNSNLEIDFSNVEPLKQDASSRTYKRIKSLKSSYILMNSTKDLDSWSKFLNFTELFTTMKVDVPFIFHSEPGFILLQDLGSTDFKNYLSNLQHEKIIDQYEKVLDILIDFQFKSKAVIDFHYKRKAKSYNEQSFANNSKNQKTIWSDGSISCQDVVIENIIGSKNDEYADIKESNYSDITTEKSNNMNVLDLLIRTNFELNEYSSRTLRYKSQVFQWYCIYKNIEYCSEVTYRVLENLSNKFRIKHKSLVLRDLHAENIMIQDKKIYLIDYQDTAIGHPIYDLVSLLDDVRCPMPKKLKTKAINYYALKTGFSQEDIMNDYSIISFKRNLRILGIFAKKYLDDKNPDYLRYIPQALEYFEENKKLLIENGLITEERFLK